MEEQEKLPEADGKQQSPLSKQPYNKTHCSESGIVTEAATLLQCSGIAQALAECKHSLADGLDFGRENDFSGTGSL